MPTTRNEADAETDQDKMPVDHDQPQHAAPSSSTPPPLGSDGTSGCSSDGDLLELVQIS